MSRNIPFTLYLCFLIGSLSFLPISLPGSECLDPSLDKNIHVDLRNPNFINGTLKTDSGGVISTPHLRIQAQMIIYIKKISEGVEENTIEAERDLQISFGEYIFVGDRLEYDFKTKTGVVYNGRTQVGPWYFGGERIRLLADGSYIIYQGFVTTSENQDKDWQIYADQAILSEHKYLSAKNVQFRFFKIPFLWVPSFNANLDSIFDNPISYNFRWGGHQGPRAGLGYEIFSWKRFKILLRLDYRIRRGLGGGLETHYASEDHKEYLDTINYVARDSSLSDPKERTRYRFQGIYNNSLLDDKLNVYATWDRLSDKDMATDYDDRGLELDTAGRTQLQIRRQEPLWIANFLTRVRVNDFQTVKQELPTLEGFLHPFEIGPTGIISYNQIKASYLNFKYATDQLYVRDYDSTRCEVTQEFYRPFKLNQINITPEVGGTGIYYGNSPDKKERWAAVGKFRCEVNTHIHRFYGSLKHVIESYAKYEYYTFPTSNPDQHFIFDIDDGIYRLNIYRFGIHNNFFAKNLDGFISRYVMFDLWANAFLDTQTIPTTIPRIYNKIIWNTLPVLRHTLSTAWNFEKHQLDHCNFLSEWTISEDMAIAFEYRHRGSYEWRKADFCNFILDSFHSMGELRHSPLSDRRDTLLVHFFYRINPSLAFEFSSRQGWHRRHEPNYNEFELDLHARLQSAWNVKLAWQHKENERHDDRVAFYISVGLKRPDKHDCFVPLLDF
jgi:hypothetical protein